jgi:hypothetical protein
MPWTLWRPARAFVSRRRAETTHRLPLDPPLRSSAAPPIQTSGPRPRIAGRLVHTHAHDDSNAHAVTERRVGTPDRRMTPRGGRRLRDPILNLEAHPHPVVFPSQLATWWGVGPETVLRWIATGHPRYGRLEAHHHNGTREWAVPTGAALKFEGRLFELAAPRRVPACPHCRRPVR